MSEPSEEPGVGAHADVESQWGLKLISWALLIALSSVILSAVVAVILRGVVSRDPALFAYFFALTLPASALLATTAIVFLIGFSAIYRHRGEAGAVRARTLRKSLVLLVATVVATLSLLSVRFFWPFLLPPFGGFPGLLKVQALLSVVFSGADIIVSLLLALLLYYTVVSFLPAGLLSRLNLAVILLVLGAIVTFGFTAASVWTSQSLLEFDDYFIALTALAAVLFWTVYRASARSLGRPSSGPSKT
ncbi:MAG: hypothetical protein V3W28_00140 [Thermoplasmata archaeon]